MPRKATTATRVAAPLLQHPPAGIGNAFALMGIAEEVIAEAKAEHPVRADAIHKAFAKLFPPPNMSSLDPAVYRYHARELVHRYITGTPLPRTVAVGTKAEVMVALMHASFKSPLKRDAQALYEMLFADCFGEARADEVLGAHNRATFSYQGALDDILNEMRHQLAGTNGR